MIFVSRSSQTDTGWSCKSTDDTGSVWSARSAPRFYQYQFILLGNMHKCLTPCCLCQHAVVVKLVRTPDLWSTGHGFDFWPSPYNNSRQSFTHMCLCHSARPKDTFPATEHHHLQPLSNDTATLWLPVPPWHTPSNYTNYREQIESKMQDITWLTYYPAASRRSEI